jgi:hypothetical protein
MGWGRRSSILCNFLNYLNFFQPTFFPQQFNILNIIYGIRPQIYGQEALTERFFVLNME